jgi:hypothetical protein
MALRCLCVLSSGQRSDALILTNCWRRGFSWPAAPACSTDGIGTMLRFVLQHAM